ncbi:hypothetical protein EV182_006126, partial [Spiromyces aspiralis]
MDPAAWRRSRARARRTALELSSAIAEATRPRQSPPTTTALDDNHHRHHHHDHDEDEEEEEEEEELLPSPILSFVTDATASSRPAQRPDRAAPGRRRRGLLRLSEAAARAVAVSTTTRQSTATVMGSGGPRVPKQRPVTDQLRRSLVRYVPPKPQRIFRLPRAGDPG